ncbi:hypothetical protein HWV07_00415 [Natronomonas salina]|uniref:hypothetical protein n=1 Tax=Natronomonas salina TaxID=1710540 RepID=UPI0015B52D41|nr:hypothetical protein [Natronomonas salina]QLD87576.1 hypothetical protein HWV07_00415 [Natronomonas salina]
MYGVVTRNEEETRWPEFDRAFYEVKDVSGRSAEPLESAVSMVSCFGDNAAAESDPDLVPVDPEGQRATRDSTYFDWAYVCPTHDDYRAGLLEIVEDCAAVNPDVRLDDVGFPRPEYCYCERCNERFEAWVDARHEDGEGPPPEETTVDDRHEWRADVITEFVADAADRIPGQTYMTLYPDPYEGHLYERAGIDLDAVEPYVDEFVVPLYDTHYGTTYWLESIASGFVDRLETPVSIELYAVEVDVDDLIHAAEVAGEYGESVLFGYDASNARAALRRMDADARDGVEW